MSAWRTCCACVSRAGDYRPGDRLPAIDQLARQFQHHHRHRAPGPGPARARRPGPRRQDVSTFVLDDAIAPVGLELPAGPGLGGIPGPGGASQVRILPNATGSSAPTMPSTDGPRTPISTCAACTKRRAFLYRGRHLHRPRGVPQGAEALSPWIALHDSAAAPAAAQAGGLRNDQVDAADVELAK